MNCILSICNPLGNSTYSLVLEAVRQINSQKYVLHINRRTLPLMCYILTRAGVETGFVFEKGNSGPCSIQVNESIVSMDNTGLITEDRAGTLEANVDPNFEFDRTPYSERDLRGLNKTVDMFCRVKSVEQAEIATAVIFAYDELNACKPDVSEDDILTNVLNWRIQCTDSKDEVKSSIRGLAMLGWIHPKPSFPF